MHHRIFQYHLFLSPYLSMQLHLQCSSIFNLLWRPTLRFTRWLVYWTSKTSPMIFSIGCGPRKCSIYTQALQNYSKEHSHHHGNKMVHKGTCQPQYLRKKETEIYFFQPQWLVNNPDIIYFGDRATRSGYYCHYITATCITFLHLTALCRCLFLELAFCFIFYSLLYVF